MKRLEIVSKKELSSKDNKHFYYGVGYNGYSDYFKLWSADEILKEDEENVRINGTDRKIIKTKKGSYVLIPAKGWNLFLVGRQCGYRGGSNFKVLTEIEEEPIIFCIYKSARGNLGVSTYGYINTRKNTIEVEEKANGRLYGAEPVKRYKLSIEDGTIKETELLPQDDELENLLNEKGE